MKWITKYRYSNKPFLLGLIISLIGALPLGFLNIIGLEILMEQGDLAIVSFVIGIIVVEFFVLKITSFGARWLVKRKRLLLFIDIFTVLFLASIALYFTSHINNDRKFSISQLQLAQYPFILGVFLNGLNAVQWPYWSGVYICIFRTEKLKITQNANYIFIIGALIGTAIGMLFFAYAGQYILVENNIEMIHYFNPIFSMVFFILATIQIVKLFSNNYKNTKEANTTGP